METPEIKEMIRAESLTKVFNPGRGKVVEAVREASFAVARGEIFGLMGPNGAGKTTLLRMLGTIITPTSGYCLVGGLRADEQPEEVRRQIGFLSGNTKLYGRLTGREMLRYFGRLYGMEEERIKDKIEELAGLLEMGSFLDRKLSLIHI